MSIPYSKSPSYAELARRLRMKQQFVFVGIVQEQIENLKEQKQRQSRRNANKEYPTIGHADLTHAVTMPTCVVTHVEETLDALGWNMVVNGQSKDGLKLRVHVCMSKKDDDSPLTVMIFDLVSEEAEIKKTGGSYALPTLQ